MANYNKFNSLVAALANKVHNLGADQLMIALCAAANAPVAGNAVLADLTQIAYTNLSSRVLTVTSSAQTAGVYKLIANDLVLTATAAVPTFRYVVIYNNTATNKELIGWYDAQNDVTLPNAGDNFTIDLDNVNGILTLQ